MFTLKLSLEYFYYHFFRKVELHPNTRSWSMGNLAANLLHNFRFDGIHYDRCIDTSVGALPLRYIYRYFIYLSVPKNIVRFNCVISYKNNSFVLTQTWCADGISQNAANLATIWWKSTELSVRCTNGCWKGKICQEPYYC